MWNEMRNELWNWAHIWKMIVEGSQRDVFNVQCSLKCTELNVTKSTSIVWCVLYYCLFWCRNSARPFRLYSCCFFFFHYYLFIGSFAVLGKKTNSYLKIVNECKFLHLFICVRLHAHHNNNRPNKREKKEIFRTSLFFWCRFLRLRSDWEQNNIYKFISLSSRTSSGYEDRIWIALRMFFSHFFSHFFCLFVFSLQPYFQFRSTAGVPYE